MSYEDVKKVWMNGKLVDWADAKIHIARTSFHYGTGVFEGARVLQDHARVRRLPARRAHRAPLRLREDLPDGMPYTPEQFRRGDPRDDPRQRDRGLLHPPDRLPRLRRARRQPASTAPSTPRSCVWDWGTYLGKEALEQGVDVKVSSWTRMAPNTLPAMAKSAANYAELAR